MYAILVVDDEPRHRKGLVSIIREHHADYDIYEAKNGKQAINIISEHPIDIVITDIEMPVVNGIELLKHIHENDIKLKTVVLSAYGEFEYAQQAIKMGVLDYVIKPVNKESINKTIDRLISDLEKEKKLYIQKENLELALTEYKNQFFNNWVRGNKTGSGVYNIDEEISGSAGFISVIEYGNKDVAFFDETNISQRIKNNMQSNNKVLAFEDDVNKNRIIVVYACDENEYEARKIRLLFNNFLRDIQHSADACIGVSSHFNNIKEMPKEALIQAEHALKYHFYADNPITFFKDINIAEYKYCKKSEEESGIIKAILSGNKDELIVCINRLLESLVKPAHPYISNLKEVIINITKNVIAEVNNNLFEDSHIIAKAENTITDCRSYQNLSGELANIMLEFMSEFHAHKENNNQYLFRKVKDYLEQNYSADLSLEEVSSRFYLSAPYFSKVFKRINGMNFSKYIQLIRINKAKDLLVNSHMKIYEIGNKVGYRDVKYFIRIFNKELGLSPKEYRRLSVEGISDLKNQV